MKAVLMTRCRSVPVLEMDDASGSDEERGLLKAMSFADFGDLPTAEVAVRTGRESTTRRWGLLLLILVILGVLEFQWPGQPGQKEVLELEEEEFSKDEGRSYLKEGSLYQNEYMTLWNANHVAISVTLKMQDLKHFELRINNLNSKGGGNDGWFAVRGSFQLIPLDAEGQFFAIGHDARSTDSMVVEFDESLQDGATLLLYRVMRKLGGAGLMKVLQLKVDANKDLVLVKPQHPLLRTLWDEPVTLRLTSEDRLWHPELGEVEDN